MKALKVLMIMIKRLLGWIDIFWRSNPEPEHSADDLG